MSARRLVAVTGAVVDALLRRPELLRTLQEAPQRRGAALGVDDPALAHLRWADVARSKEVFTAADRWLAASCDVLRGQQPEDAAVVELLDLGRPASGDLVVPPQRLLPARMVRRLTGVLRYADTAAWLAALVAQEPAEPAEVHKKRIADLRRRLERAVVVDQGLWLADGAFAPE